VNLREYRQMFDVEETHWWYATLHDLVLRVVARERREERPLKILDAGCGTGRLCSLLATLGEVTGCDSSDEALAFCRERRLPDLFRADLNHADLGESRYDVITAIDVLYHRDIVDDRAVVARLHRALRPGGLLVVNLVAFELLRSSHDLAVQTRKRYTRRDVRELLAGNGFRVELVTCRLALLFLPIAALRLVRRLTRAGRDPAEVLSDVTAPPPLLNRLLRTLTLLENRVVLSLPLPLGTSVFALARKI
jgi:SAM-dependent methyltransferase